MSFGKQNKNNVSNKRFNSTYNLNRNELNTYVRSKFWPSLDESEVTNTGNNLVFLYRVNRKNNYFQLSTQYNGQFPDSTNSTGFTVDWGDGTNSSFVGTGVSGTATWDHTYNWADVPDSTRFDVTFSTGTNLVNKTSHGLVNGDKISFSEIVTTTSLTQDYEYYIINATVDNFQISKTLNGTAETINANGIGYVLPYKIVKVIFNGNFFKITNDVLTAINHFVSFGKPTSLTNTNYSCGVLDLITCCMIQLLGTNTGSVISYPYLEKIMFKNTFSSGSYYKRLFSGNFFNCYSLQKIVNFDEPDKLYFGQTYPLKELFYNCYKLKNVQDIYVQGNLNEPIDCSSMFYNCYDLETSPKIIDYNNKNNRITNTNSMFYSCFSLTKIQKINTKYVTNLNSMFYGCRSLKSLYELDLTSATDLTNLLSNCYSLEEYGNLICNNNVSPYNLFGNCYTFKKIGNISFPNYNGTITNLFVNMPAFEECGNINLPLATTTQSLFSGSAKLKKIGKIYAPLSTNASSMFSGCYSLIKIESLTLGTLTNTSNMFQNCYNLKNFPTVTLSTSVNINTSYMFNSCYNLQNIGDLNLIKSTNCDYMFFNCVSMKSVGQITFNPTTNFTAQYMFQNCNSLTKIPYMNLSYCTNMTSMFNSCYNLQNIGDLNVSSAKLTTVGSLFSNCQSIDTIGSINLSGVTSSGTAFAGCYNLSKLGAYGMRYGHSLSGKLDKTDLETYFNNLGSGIASPGGLTLENMIGSIDNNASFVKTGSVGAIGATTITNSNTSNIYVGSHLIVGPTLTRTVNLTTSTNTITINNHGIPNGKMVSMTTTAGGLTNNVPYYVVNSTTNTFGLSTTVGGTAITFTATTTNTMRLYHQVTAVNTNVSYTIDTPLIGALTTGTSVTFRYLDVTPVLHRGFTITG